MGPLGLGDSSLTGDSIALAFQYISSSDESFPTSCSMRPGSAVCGTRATLVEISPRGGTTVVSGTVSKGADSSEMSESSGEGRTFSKFVFNRGGRWS